VFLHQPQNALVVDRPLHHEAQIRPDVAVTYVLVADPEGRLRMAAFFYTDLQATPVEVPQWVVMRWSVEVTLEETRANLGWIYSGIGRTKLSPARPQCSWCCSPSSPCWQ
jgi:hypothetical protein